MCLDSQDHLGEVQHQRHQGVGQEQGLPQRANLWKKITLIRVVQDHYDGHSKVFLDRQGHMGEVHCHLGAFGTFRNARGASGAQRCECFKCDKSFTVRSHLKNHERIHTGEKPFACPKCEKWFTESGHLKKHERAHTGEKPFACPKCEKSFTESGHFRKHERTHTGEKPFACSECYKSFNDSGQSLLCNQKSAPSILWTPSI